ncbi:MFS general substrate transporter [Saccharata proteae CBS 121410]|uniref:MFS general substrate transporter n=1 Tax=Saccharata proteae CBS 121410 TaxID=1314787 RepID=A0A9P4HLN9_9PEZI|nr:MFS general substrate transporter [Saccharata proteae CBS 121410]
MAEFRDEVPGTEYLVDVTHNSEASHAAAGKPEVVLIPQPTLCGSDPLRWSWWKKYYQLFLLALYACAFSYGENTLGSAWETVSEDTGVSLTNMNGGSALDYLLLGFVNIFWIPAAMKIGRRPVFIATLIICTASAVWGGCFHGTAQWMINNVLNGFGTSAYEAVIQLSVFDTFFVHERGRSLSFYLFGQQLGSILGLITGGIIAHGPGWRWSQFIVAIINGFVLILFVMTFEETLFPRFLFSPTSRPANFDHPPGPSEPTISHEQDPDIKKPAQATLTDTDTSIGEVLPDFPKRSLRQRLALWTYLPQDKTTYWQYFRRPFLLFTFPNIVISGLIFAFGCTAGIVSFNTISEIMASPPYNFTSTSTGLMFLAALVGNFVGWFTGILTDHMVVRLAARNNGVKEPEMRLWTLCLSVVYAAVGYLLYGWGAQRGLHWMAVAVGVGAMIAHQVSACSVATAYAMDCFPGISGELVVVLAICSSCVNFAISYSVQPFIDAVGYGWVFTFFGLCVVASMVAAVPMMWWGKGWRRRCAGRYWAFLEERGD